MVRKSYRLAHLWDCGCSILELHSLSQIRQHEPKGNALLHKQPSQGAVTQRHATDASAMRASLLRQSVTMQDQSESRVKMTDVPHGRLVVYMNCCADDWAEAVMSAAELQSPL